MREIVMLPLSDLQKYKQIEKKYNELILTQKGHQFGSGLNDTQSILSREEENQLHTPHLELANHDHESEEKELQNVEPLDLISTVNSRYTKRAKAMLSKLERSKSVNWDNEGNVNIEGNPLNGIKIQKVFPKIFSGVRQNIRRAGPEGQFFSELKKLKLGNLIRSVEKGDNTWYYIGE